MGGHMCAMDVNRAVSVAWVLPTLCLLVEIRYFIDKTWSFSND